MDLWLTDPSGFSINVTRKTFMYSDLVRTRNPKLHPTYQTIAKRLKDCRVNVESHIESGLKVYESTLDGIQFVAKKLTDPLLSFDITSALKIAAKPGGEKAFRQGAVEDARHWALDASMAATIGIGFREIWRPQLSTLGLRTEMATNRPRLNAPKLNKPLSDNFGPRATRLDISSLHCAVHGNYCSIHIDETGFVMDGVKGLSDDVMVTPDFLRHLLVELIWKDKLGAPQWVDLVIPDSQYSRVGLRLNLVQSEKVNLTVQGTCGVTGKFDCSGTVNLFGKHDWGGG